LGAHTLCFSKQASRQRGGVATAWHLFASDSDQRG
jgi:hypothetical protein